MFTSSVPLNLKSICILSSTLKTPFSIIIFYEIAIRSCQIIQRGVNFVYSTPRGANIKGQRAPNILVFNTSLGESRTDELMSFIRMFVHPHYRVPISNNVFCSIFQHASPGPKITVFPGSVATFSSLKIKTHLNEIGENPK